MRTVFFTVIAFSFLINSMPGQTPSTPFSGNFFLEGVREVASGFRFNPDQTFDFFFMYGALDRFGKGTYEQRGDSLLLHSQPKPERDFILNSQRSTNDEQLILHITDPNPMVLPYIYASVQTTSGNILEGQCDQEGYVRFDKAVPQHISLIHQFWPDRFSVFDIEPGENNWFEFSIDPHIVDIDFNGLVLHLDQDALNGPHPLLEPGQTYRFVKE